jgi:elongation factor Ts
MAEITASMVKELREATGAGMMDAKAALVENKGNMEAATDWLRTKGLAKAAKKSSRTAAEGLVAIQTKGNKGAVVEINSETDFVARNAEFQDFVRQVANVALNTTDATELAAHDFGNGKKVSEALTDLIAKIGENMTLRRSHSLNVNKGVVVGYIHSALAPNLGKIGVLVALESDGSEAALQDVGKQVAMHIAAANPAFLTSQNVDAKSLEREKAIFTEQARESGKPDNIIEKMVEGRVRKYYEEVCLMDQTFVIDGETKMSKVLEDAAKKAGAPVKVASYVRFQLGEGIEKEEQDFAAEVAKVANG